MKTILIKMMVIYIIFSVSCKISAQPYIWNNSYGSKLTEKLNCICATENGYLSAGYAMEDNSGFRKIYYISVNAEGNLIWEKIKVAQQSEFITDCSVDSKNGFYLLGNSIKSKDVGNETLFIKIDDKGEILFEKKFPGGEKQIATCFAKSTNDEFFISGSFENKSDRDKDVWLLKLDKKGSRVWQSFSANRYNEDEANALIITPEDEYVAAGWLQNFQTKDIDFYLIKFNKYGQKVWEKTYSNDDIDILNSIVLTPSNDYIVVGSSKSNNGNSNGVIMKIDKTGKLIWQKKLGEQGDDVLNSVIAANNEYIAGGYTAGRGANTKQVWLVKFNENGEITANLSENKNRQEVITDISFTNSKLVASGWNEALGSDNSDAWIINAKAYFESTKPENQNTQDKDSPQITIISPELDENGYAQFEANKPRQIVGKVQDANGIVEITVNGKSISYDAQGLFTADISQNESDVIVYAKNKLGKFSEKNVHFPGGGLDVLNLISNSSNFKRVALIIGNKSYKTAPLKNPVNDAIAIGKELKKLNFDVIMLTDASYKDMKRGISDFGTMLSKDRNTVGLFYYAGHGIQLKGKNYIVPIDEQITNEADVEVYAIELDALMANLEYAGNTMNIIILDACRNNPFGRGFRSSAGNGLAATNAPVGTFIAYATAPGSVAADGSTENGLYTQELLKVLKIPNLKIEDIFKKVRTNVKEISKGQQIPWENSALEGDFIFNINGKPKK